MEAVDSKNLQDFIVIVIALASLAIGLSGIIRNAMKESKNTATTLARIQVVTERTAGLMEDMKDKLEDLSTRHNDIEVLTATHSSDIKTLYKQTRAIEHRLKELESKA